MCIPATSPENLTWFRSIELNELHLALVRQNLLDEWMPEIEIRSRNELTSQGYAKYYDAIVTLRLGSSRPRFALEYERSPKTSRQYYGIRQTTDRETQVDKSLYLVANDHLRWFLMQCFAQTKRRLYIGRASEFPLKLLDTPRSGGGDWPADEVR